MINSTDLYKIDYLADKDVDYRIDRQLKEILSICFPEQPVFLKQRYFFEMPQHRWIIFSADRIIAHAALHEKQISINNSNFEMGCVAEVCVHPQFRGKGIVHLMLQKINQWLKERNFDFAFLFANHPNVYSPSGYFVITNQIRYYDPKTNLWHVECFPDTMACAISGKIWPGGVVDLKGPKF